MSGELQQWGTRNTASGLSYGYFGGTAIDASTGKLSHTSDASITLANNTVNYVERASTTATTAVTNTTAFSAGGVPMAKVTTSGGAITTVEDWRPQIPLLLYPGSDGGAVDFRYPLGDARRYGATGDGTTDDTAALQAMIDATITGNSTPNNAGRAYLPKGVYRITSPLTISLGTSAVTILLHLQGDGKYASVVDYTGVAGGCLVADTCNGVRFVFRDFGIKGDESSGHGIDISAAVETNQSIFENLSVFSGGCCIKANIIFSSKLDSIMGTSYNDHGIQARLGPAATLINLWVTTTAEGKACYRLCGSIHMIECNGADPGDYWLIAGNHTGWPFAGDFGDLHDYPDIVLDGCNIEAWAKYSTDASAIFIVAEYQQFKMIGGTFVRSLSGDYHSIIRAYGQPLSSLGYMELDNVRSLLSGGTATAAACFSDSQGSLLIRGNQSGFTEILNHGSSLTYPAVFVNVGQDVYDSRALNVPRLQSARLTAGSLRFDDLVIAAGTTDVDVTGRTLVRTANTSATTIAHFHFDATVPSITTDKSRNGFLIVLVEDDFTTFAHFGGLATNGLRLVGNQNYVAKKGDVLYFVRSDCYFPYPPPTTIAGWVQLARADSLLIEVGASVTYSTSMTIDASLGNRFTITPTDGVAFTINAPTHPTVGQAIDVTIVNSRGGGGTLGAATWNAAFKLAAWTQPLDGFNRSIRFMYTGSVWSEQYRSATDIPN
jgi:hypothetical protein